MLHYKTRKNGQVISLETQTQAQVSLQSTLAPAVNGAVIGVALNDKTLYQTLEKQFNEKPHVSPPKTPVLHIKTDNTHIGYGETIRVPMDMGTVYAGPALGVVIGKKACRVTEETALDYVQGYTIVNEVSLAETSFYRPAVKAKCRDTFCPIGPWVIDACHITNPQSLAINTYINDSLSHETSTQELIYSIEKVIAYISSFITLEVGDMIIAGTPLRTENLAIKAGDKVTVEIDQIGRLVNPVAAE